MVKNMENKEVYVVTGGTSFIASGLLRELIAQKKKVYAICRPGSSKMYRIPESPYINIVYCDMSQLDMAAGMIQERCDIFYHLGWESIGGKNDMYMQNRNIKYTLDAVHLAESLGCHTFLGTGSQAEYGLTNEKLTDKTPAFPITGYGMAKLCAGQMSRSLCTDLGMKHIWARIVSIYGPMDSENTMIIYAVKSMLEGKSPELTKGEQIWDYLYIDDCAKALFLLGEKGKGGQTYVIGSGKPEYLKTFVERIRNLISEHMDLKLGSKEYTAETVMHLVADISKLQKDTGFEPKITFEEGIGKIIEYYKEQVENDGI